MGCNMSMKQKVMKHLQSCTCDKTELDRKILKWCKSFREVEKVLCRGKKNNDMVRKGD